MYKCIYIDLERPRIVSPGSLSVVSWQLELLSKISEITDFAPVVDWFLNLINLDFAKMGTSLLLWLITIILVFVAPLLRAKRKIH